MSYISRMECVRLLDALKKFLPCVVCRRKSFVSATVSFVFDSRINFFVDFIAMAKRRVWMDPTRHRTTSNHGILPRENDAGRSIQKTRKRLGKNKIMTQINDKLVRSYTQHNLIIGTVQ
jgi:hypothetical protein